MKEDNFITIGSWMVTELGLSGNDLLVYALVYGFSQDGTSVFSGTSRYVADWCGITKKAALQVLKRLTDDGLLIRHPKIVNGVQVYDYMTVLPRGGVGKKLPRGVGKKLPRVGEESSPRGGEETSPLQDIYNIQDIAKDKKEQTPKKEFLVLDTYDLGKYECLRPCLTEWVEYKATVHKDKYRAKYFGKTVKDLWDMSDGNVTIAQRMIDKAISCNWKGFHKLNKDEIPEDADIPDKPISAEEALERAKRLGLC